MQRLFHFRSTILLLAVAAMTGVMAGCGKTYESDPIANRSVAMEIRKELENGAKAGATTSTASTGVGWATLKGRFHLDGEKPQIDALAGGGGGCQTNIPDNVLLVDSASKGIGYIVVYVEKVAPERIHESLKELPTVEPVFDQKDCMFLSPLLAIRAGSKVKFKNSDNVAHNVSNDLVSNVIYSPGQTEEFTIKKATKFPSIATCSIHSWMKAYIFSHSNPYVTTTKADGSFELPNIPAGEDVSIRVWHARSQNKFNLESKDAESNTVVKVKSGKMVVNVKADTTFNLDFSVPAAQLSGK